MITDKAHAHTHLPSTLNRLAREIAAAWDQDPDLQLVIGHGSGSFGHVPANKYATKEGVSGAEGWRGFAEVWQEARALNQLVIEALQTVDLPVVAFPPSATFSTARGQVLEHSLQPIRCALEAHLIPVVQGDVVFDTVIGGTILSTEEVFRYLAPLLKPRRILLATLESGVWADYPSRRQLLAEITPGTFPGLFPRLQGSEAIDVTGGMLAKVQSMLDLIQLIPDLEVMIFNGGQPENVKQALLGANFGTIIRSDRNGDGT